MTPQKGEVTLKYLEDIELYWLQEAKKEKRDNERAVCIAHAYEVRKTIERELENRKEGYNYFIKGAPKT
jgi:hypothetical protein